MATDKQQPVDDLVRELARLKAENERLTTALATVERETEQRVRRECAERAVKGWKALDAAITSAIKETDGPNRVFKDGRIIMEGEAADLYHSHLMLLRRLAQSEITILAEAQGGK